MRLLETRLQAMHNFVTTVQHKIQTGKKGYLVKNRTVALIFELTISLAIHNFFEATS